MLKSACMGLDYSCQYRIARATNSLGWRLLSKALYSGLDHRLSYVNREVLAL